MNKVKESKGRMQNDGIQNGGHNMEGESVGDRWVDAQQGDDLDMYEQNMEDNERTEDPSIVLKQLESHNQQPRPIQSQSIVINTLPTETSIIQYNQIRPQEKTPNNQAAASRSRWT